MSKTTFVDGNPSEGVAGTIVTADFLNAVNNHHHTGRDVDGEGALAYAADTGEANAYAIALSPALTAYITGMPICFKAGNANTGASTIDVNGLGAKAIKKNGSDDLAVGDILAGQIVTVIYDGTNFQVMNAGAVAPVRDTVRNLVIKNSTSNPTYQIDISADEVILQDAYGNPARMLSLSITVDITTSGAGGLDTGSEAASTWYHMWAIMKRDGTKSVILSASATTPTLPSGYTHRAYLGAVYNNASGNLVRMKQQDRRAVCPVNTVLSAGTATTWTAVSLAAIVPATAKKIAGSVEQSVKNQTLIASEVADFENALILEANPGTVPAIGIAPFELAIVTSQTIYYYNQVSGGNSFIYISGWEY
jgi:hypothetical protein